LALGLQKRPDIIGALLDCHTSAVWDEGDGWVDWSGLATLLSEMTDALPDLVPASDVYL
jgi:hypothetical protein